jgi:hypothetical protein
MLSGLFFDVEISGVGKSISECIHRRSFLQTDLKGNYLIVPFFLLFSAQMLFPWLSLFLEVISTEIEVLLYIRWTEECIFKHMIWVNHAT